MKRGALLAALLAVAPALAGCATDPGASRGDLVPYPHLHDAATYAVEGAYVELGRWENGHDLAKSVRFRVEPGPDALDGARTLHPTFLVATEVGGARHADLYVSPAHEGIVQSVYPLAGDQSIVAFDERGYPWLFGASALIGQDVAEGRSVAFAIPDNLGVGRALALAWRVDGREQVGGIDATRLVLEGAPGIAATLWLARGSPWPLKADVTLLDASAEPLVRSDGGYPAHMVATRSALESGADAVAPRDRGAAFAADEAALATAQAWSGAAPPDGPKAYVPYTLGSAMRDAALLDPGLRQWSATAKEPRLYRATFKEIATEAAPLVNETWLLVMVDRSESYYQVQMGLLAPAHGTAPSALPLSGAPRVESSGPAPAPSSSNHGWFPQDAVPAKLVPLSTGIDVVRQVFGAKGVQIFLRSFATPAGYQYFLDGGWDGDKGEKGRYTVVYDPQTGFIQEATGHGVSARLG